MRHKKYLFIAVSMLALSNVLQGCSDPTYPDIDKPDPNRSETTDILSFDFTGLDQYPDYKPGDASVTTIDKENGTITVDVPWYVGTVLTPVITVSEGATVSPISGSARDFGDEERKGIVYTVRAENGKKREWKVFVEYPVTHTMPLYSNSYVNGNVRLSTSYGLNCSTADGYYSVYFIASKPGELGLALRGASGSSDGNSLNVKAYVDGKLVNDHEYVYSKTDIETDTLTLRSITVPEMAEGHSGVQVRLDISATGTQNGSFYFRFPELWLYGKAAKGSGGVGGTGFNFVTMDNEHFGRRGPSVHLTPTKPEGDMEYFYSEVTVPEGQDILGSYFMCNGFGGGYAGIQVNSATERRILFSVWGAFNTDNPGLLGKYAPKLVRVNNQPKYRPNFRYGTFGNEGSGAQSYLRLNWEAGKTYKMLTRVRPHPQPDKFPNSTLYKCWFHNGEEWIFIAEWRRVELGPDENNGKQNEPSWYTSAYHFLENFSVNTGNQERYGTWDNEWYIGKDGTFHEPTEWKFSYDDTGKNGHRIDHNGGLMKDGQYSGAVYLRMGGYFTDNQPVSDVMFTKPAKGNMPSIDFEALNKMGTDDPAVDTAIDAGERYTE